MMKTTILFLTLLIYAEHSFSQDTTKYVEKYDNGVVEKTGLLIDGNIQTGQWRLFYPSGNIKAVYNFENDIIDGKVIHYYENGQVKRSGVSYDFDEEGEWRTYYESGELKSIVFYEKGNEQGEKITFYKNGKGKYEEYYENGVLVSEKAWFENGNMEYESSAPDKDGKEVYKEYYETGILFLISESINGKKHGARISYNKNGSVSTKGQYENDVKVGKWYDYDDNGKLASKEIYLKGKMNEYTVYDRNEEKIITFRVSDTYETADLDLLESKVRNSRTIKINKLTWMTTNLNVTHFRNGDKIFHAKTREEWIKAAKNKRPAWCYPNFEEPSHQIYGKLYNWYAVNDPRNIAPKGWRVSSQKDWESLTEFLGGKDKAGIQIRSNLGWGPYSGSGANSTGLSIIANSYISASGGTPLKGGYAGLIWCSDELSSSKALSTRVKTTYIITDFKSDKGTGYAVRCVKAE